MMRFLLDCLRPGRQRASCGRENSVEIQTKERDPGDEHELKDLEDVVAMEEGALQRDRAQCRDSQQALESLANRRTQLREEIERIQEQRKQEGQLLLSLQEEQEDLEQRVEEYDAELTRAKEELCHLQEEISSTRARVEEVHGRMGPLKHCIGQTYTEITEAKQRLGELITEMIAIEACAPEITSHQNAEGLSMSRDEDEEAEEHCDLVYEEEKALKHQSLENETPEQEHDDGPEKLQRSAENLKSSGSSSFTEITLTEFKEEDASPRSITSQHTGSADLEEEDFEIVQSLMSKPLNQTPSKEFDFFHPDPFVDYDVFGDERFPKVDMTEFLSGDPFKGSDPFACDNMFNDVSHGPFPQDSPLSEEADAKESSTLPSSPESVNKEKLADISNVAHVPTSSNGNQSIDSGMFEQNIPELADSEKNVLYNDVCPQVGIEITVTQDHDNLELSNTLRNESELPASPGIEDGGRFDPIVCEHNDIPDSESSSTVNSSFDGDFGTAEDHPEGEPEVEAGPSYVRRNQALYGLQRIDTSSYTSFPLSPEAYDPEPFPDSTNADEKPTSFSSDHNTVIEMKPSPLSPEAYDPEPFPESTNVDEKPTSFSSDHNTVIEMKPFPLSPEAYDPEPFPDSTNVDEKPTSFSSDHNTVIEMKPFPLSREAYDPEPFPDSTNVDEKPTSFSSDHNTVIEMKPEMELIKETEGVDPGNSSPLKQEIGNVKNDLCSFDLKEDHFSSTKDASHNEEPSDTDDHKFGDIYFFTVRLDPGSSDASPVSPEVSERKKSDGDHVSPESVDTEDFDYAVPEDEHPPQCSLEDYPEESFDKEESEVRLEEPPVWPEPDEPIETEAKNPHSITISLETEDPSAGLDPFECNIFELESNNAFIPQTENTEASTMNTNSESCNTEPVVQYLISPVFGDTGMFATDGYKLCARDPFSFDTGSIDHCDNTERNLEPPETETCIIKESGPSETSFQSLVLLDPVLLGNSVRSFEAKNPNTDSGRLDSGYHEFSGLDPFSPAPTDSRPVSIEMSLGSVTDRLEIEMPNLTNLDVQVSDPFSPESSDTTLFDSEPEICNPVTIDGTTKDSGLGCTGSSDVLADSFSGSELDSFDPFSPMPGLTGSSHTPCNTDTLVPTSVQDDSRSYEDNRSSSWDSEVSQSPQLHCDSAPNRADSLIPLEANLVSPDTQNLNFSSNLSTTDFFFQSDSGTLTDVGSFTPKVEKIAEQDKNSTVGVTAMEDLAEIDFFCSELSKIVASRSSDTVQQSVTEMLFGSNPDTAKFYPWELENSTTDIKENSSPEVDFGHIPEEAEKPCLL